MVVERKNEKKWWERFERFEEDWKRRRREERLEDARKLREAEEDYEESLHSLNPLVKPAKPREILATRSREPGTRRIPLQPIHTHPLIMPARIDRVEQPGKGEAVIVFSPEGGDIADILEPVSFQIKRLIEYMINERLLFSLHQTEQGAFVIRAAGERDAPPLIEISRGSRESVRIVVHERSLSWSPGYHFDLFEILKRIAERLQMQIGK
ncbi:MAG: hypothetical protein ACMUIS_00990 [bacterium]